MPALVAGIHVLLSCAQKTWMAGTSPAMADIKLFAQNNAAQSTFSSA
jgi:hypothetical protein